MYNSNNIADRIKKRANFRGISIKQLLIDTKLGKNTLSNFKTSMPKSDNLAKIADYLDCSVDYLLGRTDYPEINNGQIIIDGKTIEGVIEPTETGYILRKYKKE